MLAARADVDRARLMLAEALALYESIGMLGYARQVRCNGSGDSNYRKISSAPCMTGQRLLPKSASPLPLT